MDNNIQQTEPSDARAGLVAVISIGFAAILVAIAFLLWWQYGGKLVAWRVSSPRYSVDGFPRPRLLLDPSVELAELRARDKRETETYAWADENHQEARIPIARAMKIIADRKLITIPKSDDDSSAANGDKSVH